MKTIFNNIPCKSLLVFTLTLLGSWNRASSLLKLERFYQTPLALDIKNGSTVDLTNILALEIYSCFLWFLSMLLILEIISFSFTSIRRHSNKFNLKDFIKRYVKILIQYSLCYLLYMSIYFAAYFICDMHKNTPGSSLAETTPLTKSIDRNLQETYSDINMGEGITGQLVSPSSSSTLTKSIFLIETDFMNDSPEIFQMTISSDSNTAFALTKNGKNNSTSLLIFNVTIKDSPSLMVNFPLVANNASSSYRWAFLMVLSPDEKTMVIGTYYTLQVVDISDLKSPVSLCLISRPNTTYSNYLNFSSDGQTIFASIDVAIPDNDGYGYGAFVVIDISNVTSPTIISSYNFASSAGGGPICQFIISDDYSTAFLYNINIEIVNITDLHSPQLISSISTTYIQNLQFYQGNLYAEQFDSLLIYNISDLRNLVLIANLNFSTPYENYTHNLNYWAIREQLGFITYGEIFDSPILRIVNISSNTILNTVATINYPVESGISEVILAESPDGRYIFFSDSVQLYVYDVALQSLIKGPQVPVTAYDIEDMIISSDGKTLFIVTTSQLWIVQLNLDMEARQALNLIGNQVGSIDYYLGSVAVCSKTNKLYILDYSDNELSVVDITNPAAAVEISSPYIEKVPYQITVSSNEEYLFGIVSIENSESQFRIYNLSDGQIVSSFRFVPLNYDPSFVMTPDSNTVLILQGTQNFIILDVSNRVDIQLVSNTSNANFSVSSVILSSDGKTAFLIGLSASLWIYDISTPSNPILLSIYDNNHSTGFFFMNIAQSLDGNTAFITTTQSLDGDTCTLNIVDVSSLSSPSFITAISLPDACLFSSQPIVVPMISNGQTLFLPLNQSLAVIDVTLVESPAPLEYYLGRQPNVTVSPDSRTLIVTPAYKNISLITLIPENILYSEINSFPLGQTNSTALGVFTRNPSNTYDIQLSNQKFIDMSLSVLVDSFGTMVQNEEILPNWMTFDQNSGIITFSPNSGSQIGVYVLSAILSKQIPNNTFIGVGPINNTSDSFNLFVTLVSFGYLDNQGYLTSSFDSTQPILLPQQYINEELLIRQRLADYSIKASTQVYITQSLTLTLSDSPSSSLSIDTLSLEPLNIMITLEGNGNVTFQPKFVTTGYSFTASFSKNNTIIIMVMSLFDANTAIPQLIVFLNGSQSCSANITIIDGLNPTLTERVPDISQYFKVNSQPTINATYFLSQLAKISPQTGQQFVFQIDSSTFSDVNNESLTLSIQMNDGSPVPEWLELKDLSIIGTFPDQITGREIDLILTVSNQYQSNEVGFTLGAGISIEYAFRLIGTYGGALITLIGLFVYAPHIYNILAKKYYRYPKDFTIIVGQEINPKVLYPIYFGLEPLYESKIIMHEIDKKVAQHIGNNNKVQIAAYFTGSNSETCKIDRAKLTETIEHTAAQIREKDNYKLRLYPSVLTPQKELINQLIINNYIMRLLDSEEAKSTKAAFNLIKRDVFRLVNLDKCLQDGLCVFSVNTTRLYSELRKYNIKTSSEPQTKQEEVGDFLEASQAQTSKNQTKQDSLEAGLVPKVVRTRSQLSNANINIDLLICIMEAYAFNQQIIDADILKVNVVTKERLANIWPFAGIRRFLKLDLEPINLIKKGRFGYGIKYNIQENCLIFYGTTRNDIKNKTIVMQIVTRRGKILREIWVLGVDGDAKSERELLIN